LCCIGFLPQVGHDDATAATAPGQKSAPAAAVLGEGRAVQFGAQIPMITELGESRPSLFIVVRYNLFPECGRVRSFIGPICRLILCKAVVTRVKSITAPTHTGPTGSDGNVFYSTGTLTLTLTGLTLTITLTAQDITTGAGGTVGVIVIVTCTTTIQLRFDCSSTTRRATSRPGCRTAV